MPRWVSAAVALLLRAPATAAATWGGEAATRRVLRSKPAETRWFLVQFSNQFCGGSPAICQEVFPDDFCHLTTGSAYVRMTPEGGGKYKFTPGSKQDCECANGPSHYTLGQCSSGGGIGVKLMKGNWCEPGTFQECFPDDAEFTKFMKQCNSGFDSDVAGARHCNMHFGLHLEGSRVLNETERAQVVARLHLEDVNSTSAEGHRSPTAHSAAARRWHGVACACAALLAALWGA